MNEALDAKTEEILKQMEEGKRRIFEETGEKECEICGVWFSPKNGNQKYCEKCGRKSDVKKKWAAQDIERSIYFNGRGTKPEMYTFICKECGKEFEYPYEKGKDFCSGKCRTAYTRKHAVCAQCGKNLFELGIDAPASTPAYMLFCSDGCKTEYELETARRTGNIAICKNCWKEVIGRERKFCCAGCQREYAKKNARKNQETEYVCQHCGKVFMHAGPRVFCSPDCRKLSAEAIKRGGPDLTEYEQKERARLQHVREMHEKHRKEKEALKKQEKAQKKTRMSADEIREKEERKKKLKAYIEKNGLCSICKTPYADCERMQTDFRMSPEGASFKGNLVIRCPKFTGRKK